MHEQERKKVRSRERRDCALRQICESVESLHRLVNNMLTTWTAKMEERETRSEEEFWRWLNMTKAEKRRKREDNLRADLALSEARVLHTVDDSLSKLSTSRREQRENNLCKPVPNTDRRRERRLCATHELIRDDTRRSEKPRHGLSELARDKDRRR